MNISEYALDIGIAVLLMWAVLITAISSIHHNEIKHLHETLRLLRVKVLRVEIDVKFLELRIKILEREMARHAQNNQDPRE